MFIVLAAMFLDPIPVAVEVNGITPLNRKRLVYP